MRLIVFLGLIWIAAICNGQPIKYSPEDYINTYKDLAIKEMYRSHIPASITLAQGLLESGCGNSRLAIQGNNHFGIKCKGSWVGESIFENDDDSQECFRKYPNAESSFIDHTNFLMKQSRYGFLFDLPTTDYKAWAEGLKKAGYATNPLYPQLLITNIEKFHLAQFDVAPETETQKIEFQNKSQELNKTLFSINETQAYKAKEGDNIVSIALAFEMRIWQIKKYNDLDDSTEIHVGDTIYLKPKRNHAHVEFCKVGPRDNLRKISQRYAMKLKKIQEKNLLNEGEEPEIGELIYLQHEREQPPKLRIIKKSRHKPEITDPISGLPPDTVKTPNFKLPIKDSLNINHRWHIVEQGETLFKIAKTYEMSVEQLLKWNHMLNNTIYTGQKLWLEEGH